MLVKPLTSSARVNYLRPAAATFLQWTLLACLDFASQVGGSDS